MADNAFLIHQYSDRHTAHMKGLEEKQVIGYLGKEKRTALYNFFICAALSKVVAR